MVDLSVSYFLQRVDDPKSIDDTVICQWQYRGNAHLSARPCCAESYQRHQRFVSDWAECHESLPNCVKLVRLLRRGKRGNSRAARSAAEGTCCHCVDGSVRKFWDLEPGTQLTTYIIYCLRNTYVYNLRYTAVSLDK